MDFADWLRREALPRSKPDFAIGPQRFKELVRLRQIGSTPEAIRAYGRSQLKNLKERLKKLAPKVQPGVKFADVVKGIRENCPGLSRNASPPSASRSPAAGSGSSTRNSPPSRTGNPSRSSRPALRTPSHPVRRVSASTYFDKAQRGFYWVTPATRAPQGT